jgi:hypothetical protein
MGAGMVPHNTRLAGYAKRGSVAFMQNATLGVGRSYRIATGLMMPWTAPVILGTPSTNRNS